MTPSNAGGEKPEGRPERKPRPPIVTIVVPWTFPLHRQSILKTLTRAGYADVLSGAWAVWHLTRN